MKSEFYLVHPYGNKDNVQIIEMINGIAKTPGNYELAENTVFPNREAASLRIINHYYKRESK
jgi:hypothetical protein